MLYNEKQLVEFANYVLRNPVDILPADQQGVGHAQYVNWQASISHDFVASYEPSQMVYYVPYENAQPFRALINKVHTFEGQHERYDIDVSFPNKTERLYNVYKGSIYAVDSAYMQQLAIENPGW